MRFGIRFGFGILGLAVPAATAATACNTYIIQPGGGGAGTSAVVGTTASGGDCASAANTIAAKAAACNIATQTASSSTGGTVCTAAQAQEAQALAACYTAASCGALTGSDPQGAEAFSKCVQAVINASTTVTSGPGATATATGQASTGVASATSSQVQASSSAGGNSCNSPSSTSDCLSCTTNASCTNNPGCCENASPGGVAKLNDEFINACACAPGATCQAACGGAADICAVPTAQPSTGCVNCLNGITGTDACIPTVQNACNADTQCVDYLTCVQNCP